MHRGSTGSVISVVDFQHFDLEEAPHRYDLGWSSEIRRVAMTWDGRRGLDVLL